MENCTPHISAKPGEIAKTILLPGDPLRAKLIAEKYLENYKLVSSVRNNYCYTGTYNGKPLSVMSTGMGCASMGIYSYELFNFYGVENAIRVGTIGSLNKDYVLKDVVVAKSTITDTNYLNLYQNNGETELNCSNKLFNLLNKEAVKVGTIYTTDTFYSTKEMLKHQKDLGVIGVEMECGALYLNAQNSKKNAITICTVSDEIETGKKTSFEERQNCFLNMMEIALDLVNKL